MKTSSLAVAAAAGVLFGFGLALSTMVRPEAVLDFLNLRDLGLLFVLGGALLVTALAYQLAPRLLRAPALEPGFAPRSPSPVRRAIAGAAIFGAGWGLCGVCPGPAIAGLGVGNWKAVFALAGMALGTWLYGRFVGR